MSEAQPGRIPALDALRGVAIAAMALQHTAFFMRGSFQAESYGGQPIRLMTWPYWVSGLAVDLNAPTFWLLVGLSIPLMVAKHRRNGESEGAIMLYMMKRAAALALFDLTICDWAWRLADPPVPYTHVLLSIALCLTLLSVVRLFPVWLFAGLTALAVIWYQTLLTEMQMVKVWSETSSVWVAMFLGYRTIGWPALEFGLAGWFPIVGVGFVLGSVVPPNAMSRPRMWLGVGGALLASWFILRWIGSFGDLTPYRPGDEWYRYLMMSKTPLALTYLLFYLGIASLVLAGLIVAERWICGAPLSWLTMLGRASLFVFVCHILVYSLVTRFARIITWPVPSIVASYAVFALGMALLIPLANWYSVWRRGFPRSALLL